MSTNTILIKFGHSSSSERPTLRDVASERNLAISPDPIEEVRVSGAHAAGALVGPQGEIIARYSFRGERKAGAVIFLS